MKKELDIAGHRIGLGHPCFIIAEAGVNHNGDPGLARRLVDVAVEAGADAVKFQTFRADRLATHEAPKADYALQTTDSGESQYEMLKGLELSEDAHRDLQAYCNSKGVIFMSTPFDEESADFLDSLRIPVFKTPSPEATNLPFLAHVARKGKPMIVSTGMCNLGEVEAAVHTIEQAGNGEFVLLHCVSNYPADPADANLNSMRTLSLAFDALAGYSDHTPGIEVPLAAVALGACVIEKHLTLDKSLPGPDHRASLEPEEFTALVRGIRIVEAALGSSRKEPTASEANSISVVRKSLIAAQDIPAGTRLTEELVTAKRPGTGLSPALVHQLLGRELKVAVPKDTLFTLEMLV